MADIIPTEYMGLIVFLGAGASKPFGIPTMPEFNWEFEEWLRENGTDKELELDPYKNVPRKDFIEIAGDIEKRLSILEGLSKGLDKNSFGPVGSYYIDYLTRQPPYDPSEAIFTHVIPPNPIAKELSRKLKNFIKNRCTTVDTKKVLEVYDNFFTALVDIIKINSLETSFQEDDVIYPAINIFTTNYDRCIEIYCKERDITLNRGFKYDKSKGKPILCTHPLNSNEFYHSLNDDGIRLFKLHGSIDWIKIGNDVSESPILATRGDRTIDGEEIEDELMIYPGKGKDIWRDPLFDLFWFFRKDLEFTKFCLVIGYSFRDHSINNIFFDVVKRNPRLEIILLDPDAKDIVDKCLGPIKDNVIPIEGEFGDEKIFEELPIGKMTIARKRKIEKFKKKHQLPAGIGDDISELKVVNRNGEVEVFRP